jgi:hypothetical protein
MFKRVITYGFPFFMILIEFILRSAFKVESRTFMGPTLAATGVGLMLPLTVPKPRDLQLTAATKEELRKYKLSVVVEPERRLMEWTWLSLVVFTFVWAYSLYLSCRSPHWLIMRVPDYLLAGLLTYFVAIVLSEVKEVA